MANEYSLALTEGTLLTYEFTQVNESLIEELSEIDYFYYDYLGLQQGDQVRWKIYDIEDREHYWLIRTMRSFSPDLNDYVDNFTTRIYKHPSTWVNETFKNLNLNTKYFPQDTASYFNEASKTFPEDVSEYCYLNNTQIILNFTRVSLYNTYIYEYDDQGLLKSYRLHDLNRLVFTFRLVERNYDLQPIISAWLTIIIIGIIALGILHVMDRKKRKTPYQKVNSILEKTRN